MAQKLPFYFTIFLSAFFILMTAIKYVKEKNKEVRTTTSCKKKVLLFILTFFFSFNAMQYILNRIWKSHKMKHNI